ncbi:MAG: hypothetical protein CHACPFDD_02984 [Phycisphaerae bacterium]|nr:hypothetical protein [Phycisphaerae bacterium]
MRQNLALLVLFAGGLFSPSVRADGHILIRVSCKVIVNVFEELPSGFHEEDIAAAIDAANQQMDAHGRGYRFVLVEPVIQIGGGASGRPLPSTYFHPEFSINEYKRDEMEEDALANPGLYAWNSSAVNIFINDDSLPLCPRTSDRLIALPHFAPAGERPPASANKSAGLVANAAAARRRNPDSRFVQVHPQPRQRHVPAARQRRRHALNRLMQSDGSGYER